MKILIAYATKYGTTKECAELLAGQLKNHDVTLFSIGDGEMPDTDGFDVLVFGSNIRMTKINKSLSKYLAENKDTLATRRCAYFLCCGFTDCFEDYLYKNIPEELLDSAVAVSCFGGSLDKTRAKGIDRFVISAVRSNILGGGSDGRPREDVSLPTIMDGNIAQMADRIVGR